jgi:hypothetical protein
LVGIPLDRMKPPAGRELSDVEPDDARRPRPQRRSLQSIGPVCAAVLIEQQRKWHLRLTQPGARPPLNAEGDDQHLGVEPGEFTCVAAQPRRVLPAGQSAEVAEKDQQYVPAARDRLTQRTYLSPDGGEAKLRGGVAGPHDHCGNRCQERRPDK